MIKLRDFDIKEKEFISYVFNYEFLNKNILNEEKIKFNHFEINKIIRHSKIKIIISDNIRIGISIKFKSNLLIFILPFAYINKLIDIPNLKKLKIIDEKKNKNQLLDNFRFEVKQKYLKNIQLKNAKNVSLNKKYTTYKNIIILGPKERNKKIKKFLENDGYKVVCTSDRNFHQKNNLKNIDFILSSGCSFKISKNIIKKFENRIINLHASFLPWGKGIGGIFFSMLQFEPLGLSLHLINNKFDQGDLLCRKLLKPRVSDTSRSYYKYSLKELDKYFFDSWRYVKFDKYDLVKQANLKVVSNYHSRNDFEQLISKLPMGYDTKLLDLSIIGIITNNNLRQKDKLKKYIKYN